MTMARAVPAAAAAALACACISEAFNPQPEPEPQLEPEPEPHEPLRSRRGAPKKSAKKRRELREKRLADARRRRSTASM